VATVQPQSPAFRFDEPLTDDDLDALADDVESAGIEFDWMTGFLTAMEDASGRRGGRTPR
jgi:hypothetical protein